MRDYRVASPQTKKKYVLDYNEFKLRTIHVNQPTNLNKNTHRRTSTHL